MSKVSTARQCASGKENEARRLMADVSVCPVCGEFVRIRGEGEEICGCTTSISGEQLTMWSDVPVKRQETPKKEKIQSSTKASRKRTWGNNAGFTQPE